MNKIITISREYGAGGHSIGKRVAEELGIPFYDRDILKETVKASGFDSDLVETEQEDVSRTESFFKSLCNVSSLYYNDTQTAIHDVQQGSHSPFCAGRSLCHSGPLRRRDPAQSRCRKPERLHLRRRHSSRCSGQRDHRLHQRHGTAADAGRRDSRRHNYYTHYTGKKWGDSHNYHLSLDSGALGYDLCVKLIVEAAKSME